MRDALRSAKRRELDSISVNDEAHPSCPGGADADRPGPARPRLRHPHRAARTKTGSRVRYRIDGALQRHARAPRLDRSRGGESHGSRFSAEMNIVERRRPQDGQISTAVDGREVDIRVSTTAVVGGEKVVMRLLDKSRPLYQPRPSSSMPDGHRRAVLTNSSMRSPYGMVICAGPTGGGKTTTLYASLGELDTPERNIMTIEDPVEYTFNSINQIQINEQAGVSFATGLRSILRQDPDVILVGEVRDVDTARIAVQSAQTGHLVLSSVHATDSISALHRFLDMGIETFLVAASVTAALDGPATGAHASAPTASSRTLSPVPRRVAFVEAIRRREIRPTVASCTARAATSARTPAFSTASASMS